MNPYKAAILQALIFLSVGFWGYAANNFAAHTAMVPLGAGILFLALSQRLKNPDRIMLLVVMLISLALFIALMIPFRRNAGQSDFWGMFRIAIEMTACALAFIVYLRRLKQTP